MRGIARPPPLLCPFRLAPPLLFFATTLPLPSPPLLTSPPRSPAPDPPWSSGVRMAACASSPRPLCTLWAGVPTSANETRRSGPLCGAGEGEWRVRRCMGMWHGGGGRPVHRAGAKLRLVRDRDSEPLAKQLRRDVSRKAPSETSAGAAEGNSVEIQEWRVECITPRGPVTCAGAGVVAGAEEATPEEFAAASARRCDARRVMACGKVHRL